MKLRQWREIKNYTKEELLAEVDKIQRRLFELKFKHKITPGKNPLEIRNLRRDISRIKTILLQKYNVKL